MKFPPKKIPRCVCKIKPATLLCEFCTAPTVNQYLISQCTLQSQLSSPARFPAGAQQQPTKFNKNKEKPHLLTKYKKPLVKIGESLILHMVYKPYIMYKSFLL